MAAKDATMKSLLGSISLIAALALTVALSGCNTIEGLGKDIKKGGEAIEKKAQEKGK
jgi:entericidin B